MKHMYWITGLAAVALLTAAAGAVPVTDGLIIHLDARSLSDLKDGDPVSLWPDSATSDSVDGTVKTALNAALPTFKAHAQNGVSAVHFDDVAKQALMSDPWAWDASRGVTVFIYCTGGEANTDRVAHVGDAGGANFKTFGCDVSSDQSGASATGSGARYNNGWTCTATAGPNPIQEGVWHASVRQIAQGAGYGTLLYAVNDFPALAVATNQAGRNINFSDTNNVVTVGNGRANNTTSGWVGGTDWYFGDVADVLVYNRQLTQVEMQAVLDYLKNKPLYGAHMPSPEHEAVGQGTITGQNVDVSFSWDTGLDPTNLPQVNPQITDHYLYLAADEPNFIDVTPVVLSAGSPAAAVGTYGPVTLNMDTVYYWRVDEGVAGSGPGEPNTIPGPVWSFETLKAVPVITAQPVDQAVFPGEDAVFSLSVTSLSDETYAWYRSEDAATDTPDDDTAVGSDADSLILPGVVRTDEGYYYCNVTNGGGANSVVSEVVKLGVKRLVGHWTLDQASLVDEVYQDSSLEDHDADPNITPTEASFVAGIDPLETNEGVDFSVDPMAAAWTKSWVPTFGTGQITVSAWVKWNGPATWAWQGLVSSRGSVVDPEGDTRNFLMEIEPGGLLRINAGGIILESVRLPVDQWAHVALTAGADGFVFYIDGKPVVSQIPATAIPQNAVPLYLGTLSRDAGGVINTFNGVMDDVQLFNYIKSPVDVADMYYEITETPICLNLDSVKLTFDVAGGGPDGDQPDCVVNLSDFVLLASNWLGCGLYPQEVCP